MDLSEFSDFNIDHFLDAPTPIENGLLSPYRHIPMTRINGDIRKVKCSRLAERIAQSDELIQKVKHLQGQNKQLSDLQRTAQEVSDLYQNEKQQRIELEGRSKQLNERCEELEKQLDVQVATCESLQEDLKTKGLPVDSKDVLGILMQLAQRLGDDCGLLRRDQNIMKKLKDYCKAVDIPVPTPKSPNSRSKRKNHPAGIHQCTQTDQEPIKEKPVGCSVAVQVENLVVTRDQSTQHINTTTTRGTTTASFIKYQDVGTCFPEPKPLPNVRQILDEMLSWRNEIAIEPLSPLSNPHPELEAIPSTVSVSTCTTLCDLHREIDFMSELPSQIKVSASRPPSRTMMDGVKEEARYSSTNKEFAKELLNFLPQNQSCLANLPPQAFEELWQVFGQMVLGLLQRRSHPSTVSQVDFTNWLYELYEGTQNQPEQPSPNSKRGKSFKKLSLRGLIQSTFLLDFAANTDTNDMGTDPIIASPNISHGGDVTPIRLSKPKERKSKSKKRKGDSILKPIPKKNCLQKGPIECQKYEKECQDSMETKEQETEPETAIQFLSTLNTFNMANCDNFDMTLDEEELYLLQLTTNAKREQRTDGIQKESESIGSEHQFLLPVNNYLNTLPAVQKENYSSFKDNEQKNKQVSEKEDEVKEDSEDVEIPFLPERDSVLTNADKDRPTKEIIDAGLRSFKELESESTEREPEVSTGQCSSLSGSDSDSDKKETELELTTFNGLNNKPNILPILTKFSNESLFGSDSELESDSSEEMLSKSQTEKASSKPKDETIDRKSTNEQTNGNKRSKVAFFSSHSDSDSDDIALNEDCSQKESNFSEGTEMKEKVLDNQNAKTNSLRFPMFGCDSIEMLVKNSELDLKDKTIQEESTSLLVLRDSNVFSAQEIKQPTRQPSYDTSDSEEELSLVIDDIQTEEESETPPSPVSVPLKRRKSQNGTPPGEVRLTRLRAKQMQIEQKPESNVRTSLMNEIRGTLKEVPSSIVIAETAPQEKKDPVESNPNSYCDISEESPASPVSKPMEEIFSAPTEIPLEQDRCQQDKGQPKSILQHVLSVHKGQQRRKIPGKSQHKLCATIGRYLKDTIQLESTCCDLAIEIYNVTKDEAAIVNTMITLICQIGIEDKPMEKLLDALIYFDFRERFLSTIELRLFWNTKDRPAIDLALQYVNLYLKVVSMQGSFSDGCENPTRLLLAKLLYHYDRDAPALVMELLAQFPTVLPHREQREYNHSDPLITVIKHLLMNRQYDMQDPKGPERLLLSKLRFEYHFQPFEPSKQQVLENLVEKLKADRLDQLGYAFALFCRRSPHLKVMESVIGEQLMPLATSYCDLAALNEEYDARLQILVQCISMALKPLPLDTDISACVGFFKRLLVAVPRPGVQQSVVQAILRLQRFGFKYVLDVLQNYRPNYPLMPLTRAMLRSCAERLRKFQRANAKSVKD
ncbi:hypothetical protein KR009_003883 [Drosophila setifemur]|nr:hypothetical protein KR009_003883 [Drosophila setifemur]